VVTLGGLPCSGRLNGFDCIGLIGAFAAYRSVVRLTADEQPLRRIREVYPLTVPDLVCKQRVATLYKSGRSYLFSGFREKSYGQGK
jgi:hypothetical protein